MVRTSIFAVLALCAASSIADSTVGWVRVQPEGKGFTVLMPVAAKAESRVITDDDLTYRAYRYSCTKNYMTYTVICAPLKVGIPPDKVDGMLQNVISGLLQAAHGSLLHDDKVDVQGKPARIFMTEDQLGFVTSGMTCWDGQRFYCLTLNGPIAQMDGNVVRDYFKTFRLLNS